MRCTTALISVSIVFSTLAACSSDSSGRGYTEQVIDGVRVRSYELTEAPRIDPFEVVPSTVFGGDQNEDTYLLRGIHLLGISNTGLLVASDMMSTRIHIFDSDGTHLRELGRSGQGPGEFSMVSEYLFDGRHIHIFDYRQPRRTLMDLEGNLVSILQYPTDLMGFGNAMPRAFIGANGVSRYICELIMGAGSTTTYRYTVALRDSDLTLIETPIDTSFSFETVVIGTPGRFHRPFVLDGPATAVGDDLPVAFSWGQAFRIRFHDLISRDRWTVQIPRESKPVTNRHREYHLLENYARDGLVEEARRKLPWPSHMPYLEYMSWDTTGRLWVQEYRDPLDEEAPWIHQVFDTDGTWLFQQELPARAGHIVENGMYVSESAEDGSPIIRFYRFEAK
ncbi:6-bladed beta-propeller [Gemmatimonadota bacterium]